MGSGVADTPSPGAAAGGSKSTSPLSSLEASGSRFSNFGVPQPPLSAGVGHNTPGGSRSPPSPVTAAGLRMVLRSLHHPSPVLGSSSQKLEVLWRPLQTILRLVETFEGLSGQERPSGSRNGASRTASGGQEGPNHFLLCLGSWPTCASWPTLFEPQPQRRPSWAVRRQTLEIAGADSSGMSQCSP